jgi:hypothetical protein
MHNTLKTFYLPLVFRPYSFVRGLRILFGDQVMQGTFSEHAVDIQGTFREHAGNIQ